MDLEQFKFRRHKPLALDQRLSAKPRSVHSLDPHSITPTTPEGLGVVHLFGFCRWDDELSGRRGANNVAVVVNATPQQRGERLGTFVSQVLMVEPGAAPEPPIRP